MVDVRKGFLTQKTEAAQTAFLKYSLRKGFLSASGKAG